jgi:hypothetical protein
MPHPTKPNLQARGAEPHGFFDKPGQQKSDYKRRKPAQRVSEYKPKSEYTQRDIYKHNEKSQVLVFRQE